MLRRIADNVFWAARNLERAEWRARLVDVNYHLLIETPPRDSAPWEPLLAIFGEIEPFAERHSIADESSVLDFELPNAMPVLAWDPETGKVQWRWNSEPQPGEPGSETWPNKDAMGHGGGMTWMPGTYDPDLNLIYWGTGNPNPVHAGQGRKGDNLWTCSIVALNADTGKMAWWFQASPHDTHDWDNVETPVLFDAEFDGRPRKLVAQASRNGYFFVLDRTNGKPLVSAPFIDINWSKGVDSRGEPIPNAAKALSSSDHA